MSLSLTAARPLTALAVLLVLGCQSSPQQAATEEAAADAATEEMALPTSLPADAVQLSGDEIRVAFTNVNESYTSIDTPGITAVGPWTENTMSATWTNAGNGDTGSVAGNWRIDGDQRCIDFTDGVGGGNTECVTLYSYADGYLSVNPDGSLHGYHVNTPL